MSRTGFLQKGRDGAEDFLRHGVETWAEEGRIDDDRAKKLIASLNTPEVEAAMLHLGAHFAISLPLRFPLGAAARFFYTLGLRLRAELRALIRRGTAKDARRMHTFVVMLVSLLPGFGRLGYFFSPALQEERLLLFIPLDQAARKFPFHAYRRFHLYALFVYWGIGNGEEKHKFHLPDRASMRAHARRVGDLKQYAAPTAAILLIDALLLSVGTYLFVEAGRPEDLWWWRERGLIATFDVLQLLIGAAFGIAAYLAFWKQPGQPSRREAAGIFLWGIGGIGLAVFALDDYFTVHERLGEYVFDLMGFIPSITEEASDMLVLLYAFTGLAVIMIFRAELFSGRPSATLLMAAAAASVVMVLSDGFATTDVLMAFEYPTQTVANSLLMLAFAVRWLEVRQAAPARAELELSEAGSLR